MAHAPLTIPQLASNRPLQQSPAERMAKIARKPKLQRRLKLADLQKEPFRLFFPIGVLAGLLGVAVWPLYFGGFLEMYPGAGHSRLMGQGFFGAFIFGFLGTALPRMISAKPFSLAMFGSLAGLFVVFITSNVLGKTAIADGAYLIILVTFASCAVARLIARRDVPPPGFALVGLAFACAITGTTIGILDRWMELDVRLLMLRPLLAYQGFVLLPVLGVGAFILPKFLGLKNTHAFPEAARPPKGWWPKALFAIGVGVAIVVSFLIEVEGWYRVAYALRFVAAATYLARELPLWKSGLRGNAIGWSLRIAVTMIPVGLLSVAVMPDYRVPMLHILLVGGLGLVTIIVATRVIFGHSGNGPALLAPNRWMWWCSGLILLGMATRISGDFLPLIMASHYNYGALCWAIGIGIWSWKVLPKVLVPDDE